jgi:anaerobic carbon-monoxide dehydrogenase iron sulfur subunit
MKEIVFLKERCATCGACAAACAAEHKKNHRLYDRLAPLPMGRKRRASEGRGDPESLPPHAVRCEHCEEPACLEACISGAFGKADRVFTRWDHCVGCFMCVMNCPFGAILPFFNKAVKCDACLFTEKPACVRACPQNALLYRKAEGLTGPGRLERWRERKDGKTSFLKSRHL